MNNDLKESKLCFIAYLDCESSIGEQKINDHFKLNCANEDDSFGQKEEKIITEVAIGQSCNQKILCAVFFNKFSA